ncbi:hypothetical protein MMC29_001288 [Sticta canariensis]|nr:hypothetical protein [Sticta canariensis]
MLQAKSMLLARNSQQYTPLDLAVISGKRRIIEILLEHSGDALQEMLLRADDAGAHRQSAWQATISNVQCSGRTALHTALACQTNGVKLATCILSKALDLGGKISDALGQRDASGTPAVMLFSYGEAALGSQALRQLVTRLLQAEPNCLHVSDADGTTPLALAVEVGRTT